MPVNVKLPDGNFSFGPDLGFFYSINFTLKSLRKLEADGDVVSTLPLTGSLLRNPAKQLHFDGTSFWTLEDLPSNLGIVVKRWRLFPFKTFAFPVVAPTELRWQEELTLINTPNIRWSADGFAVEHYHRQLNGSFIRGSNTIRLNDISRIGVGDVLYLGPSSFGGFVGNEESIVVGTINTLTNDITFSKAGGLENSYISTDNVDFVKSIFLFNNHSFSGLADDRGTLVQFSWPGKNILLTDNGRQYHGVGAADFDQSILCWVRGTQIFQQDLTALGFEISTSMEGNLLEADQNTIIPAQDLIADLNSNLLYKLQQKETTESVATGQFTTVDFTPLYNFQTQTTLSLVNSVSLSFEEGRFVRFFSTGETLRVRAEVRDQYNFPVLGQSVQFSASLNPSSPAGAVGTFSPTLVVTNASGIADTIYTPSVSTENLLIDVQARVL